MVLVSNYVPLLFLSSFNDFSELGDTGKTLAGERGRKKVKVLLLASNSECLEINKVAEERHTERNKLVNFFLGKQDFAFKLGFS